MSLEGPQGHAEQGPIHSICRSLSILSIMALKEEEYVCGKIEEGLVVLNKFVKCLE